MKSPIFRLEWTHKIFEAIHIHIPEKRIEFPDYGIH